MLHIGERLHTAASMVPPCHTMADIGTDHGYLPAYLIMSGRCRQVIASDIAEGPCQAAMETRNRYNLQNTMEIRTAPGLQGLRAGAPEIAASVGIFVLQPMNAANLLRRWLAQHDYCIAEEALCKEHGHIYTVIKAVHAESRQELSSLEAELGPYILKEKPVLWQEFVKGKAEHYRHLLRQMEISAAAMNSDKYKNLKNLLAQVDGLINKSV